MTRLEVIIRCFASFYEMLEARVDEVISPALSERLNWPSRRKGPALLSDLSLFGPGSSPVVTALDITKDAEVLGALYVVEGATLGGQLIGPHISGLFPNHSIQIFSVYGDQAPQSWKVFRAALNHHLQDPEDLRAAEAMAVTTFELMRQTFERELAR